MNRRLGVLISGRGSNLQSLIEAISSGRLNATIAVVISNVGDAGGLERARTAGIESLVVGHRGWSSRDEYDRALARELKARDYGVKVSGVTVHLVTGELDAGPIVLQRAVAVLEDDTRETLSARILEQEHLAYPEAIGVVLNGGWRVDGRRFVGL